MHSLLKNTVAPPLQQQATPATHGDEVVALERRCRRRLRSMHINSFDRDQGGLRSPVKFIDRDSIEYALVQAADNDRSETEMARLTLDQAMDLLDPVWGGVYQYSTCGRWDEPHHRKTMATQAGHMRIYTLAYAELKYDRYLAVARAIRAYISRFLTSDSGSFYCSQADGIPGFDPRLYFSLQDKERRRLGIPDIDRRIRTRENGWAIEALATLYEYAGDYCSLLMALKAYRSIKSKCHTNACNWLGCEHANDANQLADYLAMGRAQLHLYRASFEPQFLAGAGKTLDAINRQFRHRAGGFVSASPASGSDKPRQIDENIALARFANLVFHHTNKPRFQEMARHAFRYLSVFEIATSRMEEAGILLLEQELQNEPLTFHIESRENNAFNNPFLDIARRHPGWYKRVSFTRANSDCAIVTVDGMQSRPVYSTERLQDLLQHC